MVLRRIARSIVSPATAEGRIERRIMIASLLGAFACAAVAFSPVPPDRAAQAAGEVVVLGQMESRAMTALQAIFAEARTGRHPASRAADRIEGEVIPVWVKARERVETARSGPLAPHLPIDLAAYFRLRQQSCQSLVAGVRAGDPALIARHREQWRAADALATGLREQLSATGR